jgi:hypothetical protein
VTGLKADSTVQIYFHLDSVHVRSQPSLRSVVTEDEDVRLIIAGTAGLECELLPGRVSEKFDDAHPSTRVRFCDRGGKTQRAYTHVLTPFRAAEKAPVIEGVAVSPDGAACTFVCDGREYRIERAASGVSSA